MQKERSIKKRLFDIKEISEYLGITVSTLYAWVARREISYVKIGSKVKFDLKVLDDWILECSVSAKEKEKLEELLVEREALADKIEEKTCYKCKGKKTLGEFHNDIHGKYGRSSRCKICSNADKRRHYRSFAAEGVKRRGEKRAKKETDKKKEREEELPWEFDGKCEVINKVGKSIFKDGKALCEEGEEWLSEKKLSAQIKAL